MHEQGMEVGLRGKAEAKKQKKEGERSKVRLLSHVFFIAIKILYTNFHARLSHTRGHLSLTILPFLPSAKALILGEDGLPEAWRLLPHEPPWRRSPWESEEKELEGGCQGGCWWD